MDPLMLHFNIFGQAGPDGPHGRRSFCVDDPRGTTIGAVKQQLFPDACQEQMSVRFISRGRILDDAQCFGQCGFDREAHIHVSISQRPQDRGQCSADDEATAPGAQRSPVSSGVEAQRDPSSQDAVRALVLHIFFVILFAGVGIALRVAWQKRRSLSLQTSQLMCIVAACWLFVLLFHGLPMLLNGVVCAAGRLRCVYGGLSEPRPHLN